MPQFSLDREHGQSQSRKLAPEPQRSTHPTVLISVVVAVVLIALLGVGWSQGWFDRTSAAPARPATTGGGGPAFSEDHPLGNKRNDMSAFEAGHKK